MINIHRKECTKRSTAPIDGEKLLFLGGVMGLTPSLRTGGNGQPLAKAAEVLIDQPDFDADAESIERELFVPEDHSV